MRFVKLFLISFLLLFIPALSFSQPQDIPTGSKCNACGMTVDSKSPFAAQIIDGKGNFHPFCDIGDMLSHYKKMKDKDAKIYVKDYPSNAWVEAHGASFVKSGKFSTPMGWGIAAFKDKAEAAKYGSAVALDESATLLGGGMKMMH